jgi:hypothetical protein
MVSVYAYRITLVLGIVALLFYHIPLRLLPADLSVGALVLRFVPGN